MCVLTNRGKHLKIKQTVNMYKSNKIEYIFDRENVHVDGHELIQPTEVDTNASGTCAEHETLFHFCDKTKQS